VWGRNVLSATVTSTGLDDMVQYLDEVAGRLRDTEPLLNRLGILARREFKQNFVQGGRDPTWPALADSTKLQKSMAMMQGKFPRRSTKTLRKLSGRWGPGKGGSAPSTTPLVASGALMTAATNRNARGNVHRVSSNKRELEVGTKIRTARGFRYDIAHNEGTKGPYTISAGGNVGANASLHGMAKLGIKATRGGPPQGSGRKMLRFLGRDKDTGQITWIYRRSVQHPGVSQRQFIYLPPAALDEMQEAVATYVAGESPSGGE